MNITIDITKDYRYIADVDSETSNNCEVECVNDYCRCGIITNARVTGFYGGSKELLTSKDDIGPIEEYVLDRIVRHTSAWDMFTVSVERGYYGQETGSVLIDTSSKAYQEFNRKIELFNRLENTTQRVQMALNFEYGYLLPEITSIEEWDVLDLVIDTVHVDKKIMSRTSDEVVNKYKYEIPDIKGVVVKDGEFYRLVDGFHRYAAWTKDKQKQRKNIKVLGPKQQETT